MQLLFFKQDLGVSPKSVTGDDIKVESANDSVLEVSNVDVHNGWFSTSLSFDVKAVGKGSTTLRICSADGSVSYQEASFTVEEPPKILSITAPDSAGYKVYVGQIFTLDIPMTPAGIAKSDIVIDVKDKNVIQVANSSVSSTSEGSVLSLDVKGISEGDGQIVLSAVDGKVASVTALFHVETAPLVESFQTDSPSSYSIKPGESQNVVWKITPASAKRDDIIVDISDKDAISFEEVSFENRTDAAYFTAKVTALNEGYASVCLKGADERTVSKKVGFSIKIPPVISKFGEYGGTSADIDVGNGCRVSLHMWPSGLTKDDFEFNVSDDSIVSVTIESIGNDGDSTLLVYIVRGLTPGTATVQVDAVDGKTHSQKLTFNVKAKEQAPTQQGTEYILNTNTKKFHLPGCSSVSKMKESNKQYYTGTRNDVISMGYSPCQKCNP